LVPKFGEDSKTRYPLIGFGEWASLTNYVVGVSVQTTKNSSREKTALETIQSRSFDS
jgi:hypothetical protein